LEAEAEAAFAGAVVEEPTIGLSRAALTTTGATGAANRNQDNKRNPSL